MNTLSKKFISGIVFILVAMLLGTYFVNSKWIEKYALYQQKETVRKIGRELEENLLEGKPLQEVISDIEKREAVLVAYSYEKDHPESLNEEIRAAFREKGLGFQQFWLWDQDYEQIIENGSKFRLYTQSKLNYSILVQYLLIDSGVFALAVIIPNAENYIHMINNFVFVLYAFAIGIAILLMVFLIRNITNPLRDMRTFTNKIASCEFEWLDIRTGDELEEVANSLNQMGRAILENQKQLELKNSQMNQLLSDVAHDLKTPISLVGMYARGMKDGLDDGEFLDTIIQQNLKMSQIIEKLLYLSSIEQKTKEASKVILDQQITQCLAEHKMLFETRGLSLNLQLEAHLEVETDLNLLMDLLSNLISNAAKYADSDAIDVNLVQNQGAIIFKISNRIGNLDLDLKRIWEPFYVGEASRNKYLSGTGLGLALVKKIADQLGFTVGCQLANGIISFEVNFIKK